VQAESRSRQEEVSDGFLVAPRQARHSSVAGFVPQEESVNQHMLYNKINERQREQYALMPPDQQRIVKCLRKPINRILLSVA
jgi:hypothetical protein